MASIIGTSSRVLSRIIISKYHIPILSSTYFHPINAKSPPLILPTQQTRLLSKKRGRKGAAMGQHIASLNEIANRSEREKKEAKKKASKKEPTTSTPANDDQDDVFVDDIPGEDQFDSPEDENPLPSPEDVKTRMLKIVTKLSESLTRIRGATPTPELFETIPIRAYGDNEYTPLNNVAQVVISSPTLAVISCYDPDLAPSVRDAVRDAGLNVNPRLGEGKGSGGGGEVLVPIPKVSAETRRALAKKVGELGESCRKRVRGIRRGAHDIARKGRDGKLEGVGKDDAFRVEKEIDAVTEEVIKMLDEIIDAKKNKIIEGN